LPEQAINIHIKLTNEVSEGLKKLETNFTGLAERGREFGQSMKQLGREVSQVGSSVMLLGTAITAPLLLAFKNAEKYSISVSEEMVKFNNIVRQLQTSIAETLVPIMHNLTNLLGRLLNAWNSLTPAQQQTITQTTFMTGVYLIMTGTVLKLIGTITKLVGIMIKWASTMALFALAHPILLAIGVAIGALIFLMVKYRDISVPVLNAIETALNMVMIGYNKLAIAILNVLKWQAYLSANFKMAEFFKQQIIAVEGQIKSLEKNLEKIEIGKGWSEDFEGLKQKITELFGMFQNPPEFAVEPMDKVFNIDTYLQQQRDAVAELKGLWAAYQDERLAGELARMQQETEQYNFMIENQKIANQSLWTIVGNLRDTFSQGVSKLFVSMIKGTVDAKEAWKEMGMQMVQTIIDYMVQVAIAFVLSKVLGATSFGIAAAQASALAAMWATPAFLASVATLGGAAATGAAAIAAGMGANLAAVTAFQAGSGLAGGGGGLTTLAEGGIVERPTLALIGERGREAVIPLNGRNGGFGETYINIEINNPTVRSDEDIDKLTEEISMRLSRETERL
jgi:hypothetical protein